MFRCLSLVLCAFVNSGPEEEEGEGCLYCMLSSKKAFGGKSPKGFTVDTNGEYPTELIPL